MQIDLVSQWLITGEIDAAVASIPIEGAEHHEVFYEERYVCLLPKTYSGSPTKLSAEEFASLRHVAIDPSAGHPQADRLLESMAIQRRMGLRRLHHFSILPCVIASSDYAAIVPLRVAELFAAQWPVTLRELPFTISVTAAAERTLQLAGKAGVDSRSLCGRSGDELWFEDHVTLFGIASAVKLLQEQVNCCAAVGSWGCVDRADGH